MTSYRTRIKVDMTMFADVETSSHPEDIDTPMMSMIVDSLISQLSDPRNIRELLESAVDDWTYDKIEQRTDSSSLVETWSHDEAKLATQEGWNVFNAGTDDARLERDDEQAIFADDHAAWIHVAKLAAAGSALHKKALRCVSVEELTKIKEAT